ncbi:uncharacterized protein LOC123704676 [Colias croceus]|uniref:uncharacterized protein LOC123704676 n=1 Tax=Colias crocea TaxID=72248 RepID=UPI001E27ABB3|nr:uncharacterized protein LOC123704676 [Colias croceus]
MFGIEMVQYFLLYVCIIFIQATTAKVDPKSVNLELETSLQFDPKHESNHSITDIKNFLNRLQNLLNPIKAMLEPNNNKMSVVIENLARRVNHFDDKDFDKITRVFLKEVDEHINNNIPLSSLLGDKYSSVIKYIHENPKILRIHTRKSADNKNYKAIKVLLSKLDKYYDKNDVEKLNKIVRKLENVPKTNEEIRKLVKNALNIVVFDKYKNLNNTLKSKLFEELLSIQRYLKSKMNKDRVNEADIGDISKYYDNDNHDKIQNEDNTIEDKNNVRKTNDDEIILDKNIEILFENDDFKSE